MVAGSVLGGKRRTAPVGRTSSTAAFGGAIRTGTKVGGPLTDTGGMAGGEHSLPLVEGGDGHALGGTELGHGEGGSGEPSHPLDPPPTGGGRITTRTNDQRHGRHIRRSNRLGHEHTLGGTKPPPKVLGQSST